MSSNLPEPRILEMSFKGSRSYLQGADLYNSLDDIARQVAGSTAWVSTVGFHKLMTTQAVVCFRTVNCRTNADQECGRLTITCDAGLLIAELRTSGEPVTGRQDFDEDSIFRTGHITDDSIEQMSATRHSPIENIVALTKHLHNNLHPPKQGRWMFTKLALTQPLSDSLYTIAIKQKLGTQMTFSNISTRGELVGRIGFTVVSL